MLLYHHRIENDEGALGVEEEQRYPIVSTHLRLLLILCGDRYGNKEGYEEVDDFVVSRHQGEVWIKDTHKNPRQADLHNDGYKKERRSVLKSKNVNPNLHEEDDDQHEESADEVERERQPEALSGSVVVGKDCLHHREEGDAH